MTIVTEITIDVKAPLWTCEVCGGHGESTHEYNKNYGEECHFMWPSDPYLSEKQETEIEKMSAAWGNIFWEMPGRATQDTADLEEVPKPPGGVFMVRYEPYRFEIKIPEYKGIQEKDTWSDENWAFRGYEHVWE